MNFLESSTRLRLHSHRVDEYTTYSLVSSRCCFCYWRRVTPGGLWLTHVLVCFVLFCFSFVLVCSVRMAFSWSVLIGYYLLMQPTLSTTCLCHKDQDHTGMCWLEWIEPPCVSRHTNKERQKRCVVGIFRIICTVDSHVRPPSSAERTCHSLRRPQGESSHRRKLNNWVAPDI